MRLPTWEELESVEEQLDVLEHPLNESLFVAGPPGSGKTVLAVRRAQMIGEVEPDVVVLTFNRMLRRLMGLLGEQGGPDGATFATMQSYVWRDYWEREGTRPPTSPHDRYAYVWPDMLHALEQRRVQPNRPHFVVDEGQDLPDGFFRYAARHISRTMSVFADDDQALAEQRTTLEQIKRAAHLPIPFFSRRIIETRPRSLVSRSTFTREGCRPRKFDDHVLEKCRVSSRIHRYQALPVVFRAGRPTKVAAPASSSTKTRPASVLPNCCAKICQRLEWTSTPTGEETRIRSTCSKTG